MQFPRLDDTAFPDLQEARPYTFKNEFDYSMWQADCRIKLCNVPWHADCKHVVDWKDDDSRNAWFDGLQGTTIELGSDSRRVMDAVPVPLTYQQAARYNYCMMEAIYPDIDHSDSPRRLFYFIIGLEYRSPNATVLQLQLDAWTTYINHVSIPYLMLARGHAPMDACSADEYLSDPLKNQVWLGTTDVDFGNGSRRVADTVIRNLGSTEKVICFASTIPHERFASNIVRPSKVDASLPSFSNASGRAGYQYDVTGWNMPVEWDWSASGIAARPLDSASDAIPHLFIYGISGINAEHDLAILQDEYPLFIRSCAACFVVPSDMVTSEYLTIRSGVRIFKVTANTYTELEGFKLDKAAFDYPEGYADIAKLYSLPYAHLELSDDAGQTIPVRIEDISGDTLKTVSMLNLAFPFLDWTVLFTNVSGDGIVSVDWMRIDGKHAEGRVYDAADSFIRLGIPTYALHLERESEFLSANHAAALKTQANAEYGYQSNVANLNTARENVRDSNATMVTNTANQGTTATANVALSVAASSANTAAGNSTNTDITNYSRALNLVYLDADNYLNDAMLDATIEYGSQSTSSAAMYGIGGAAVAGGISGALTAIGGAGALAGAIAGGELGAVGGPIGIVAGIGVGAVLGAIGPTIQAAGSATNNNLVMSSKSAMNAAAKANNTTKTGSGNANASAKTTAANNLQTSVTNTNNTLATSQNTNNVNLANTNAGNVSTTNNAQSEYSRNIAVDNAQRGLDMVQAGFRYDRLSARQTPAASYGAYTGNPAADAYRKRVITMRVVTEGAAAIKQAGDWFQRYGYAYNALWEFEGWTGAKPYSYWQAAECWIDGDSQVTDDVKLAIDAILQAGTTVWKDADTIGKVKPNAR